MSAAACQKGLAPRVMVIGLDGATLTVLRPLVAAGRLPALARLMREGAHGPLESIIPAHTGAAWPSMICGRNPGKHGLYDFERVDVANYACTDGFATAETLAGRTIFDAASARDLRVAALRVPMTYPTWPVNGVMASGYPAPPRTDRYAYPKSLASALPPVAFKIHGRTPDITLANLQHESETLTTAACQLLAEERFDLFMLVYQQPDQAHHLFWCYTDPDSPLYTESGAAAYGDLIAQCYATVDAGIARLLEYASDNTLVLVVSDHGAELAPATYFQTNDWLRELGLLAPVAARPAATGARALYDLRHMVPKDLRRTARRWLIGSGNERLRATLGRISQGTTALDWAHTSAYWFPIHQQMEGIAINLRGRQPEGIVAPGAEYEALRDRLIGELRTLRQPDSDQPLVTEVYRREEVFSGAYTERAPDLLYRLAPGFQSHNELDQSRFSRVPPHALERHSAWHDRAGIVVAHGPGVAAGSALDDARLLDVAPTVLAALDLPRSADLDGQPLAAIVGTPAAASRPADGAFAPPDVGAAIPASVPAAVSLSDEEEASIKSRLQALGYL